MKKQSLRARLAQAIEDADGWSGCLAMVREDLHLFDPECDTGIVPPYSTNDWMRAVMRKLVCAERGRCAKIAEQFGCNAAASMIRDEAKP